MKVGLNRWVGGQLRWCLARGLGLALGLAAAQARPARGATLERVTYSGAPAFRLSDGKSEAIIVPAMGGVMRYGLVGGRNWLWNAPPAASGIVAFNGWGGNRTWLAPQNLWPLYLGRAFPPDPAWSGPQSAKVLDGKSLRLTGPVGAEGVRLTRDFTWDAQGGLVIRQTAEKVSGPPMLLALWSDTQVVPCDALFLPLASPSVYRNNFSWMSRPKHSVAVAVVSPRVMEVKPEFSSSASSFYKIGSDSPVACVAAVSQGVAFLQQAARPDGDYADSAPDGGLAVQLYHHGHKNPQLHYDELELLSPLRAFEVGSRWTHSVRWSLWRLPSNDPDAPSVRVAVEALLTSPALNSPLAKHSHPLRPGF